MPTTALRSAVSLLLLMLVSCSGSTASEDLLAAPDSLDLVDTSGEEDSYDIATSDTLDIAPTPDVPDAVGPAELTEILDISASDALETIDAPDLSATDLAVPDLAVLEEYCFRSDACPPEHACNIATGLCERKANALTGIPTMYGFEPRIAAPGDRLVIDGEGFYSGLFTDYSIKVMAGAKQLSGLQIDENRIIANVPADASGTVQVSGKSGIALSPYPLVPGPSGVVPCGASDPPPWPLTANHPADPGPFAAGFVDFQVQGAGRLFYPAQCGGVRRPLAQGPFPVAIICHGDGANPLNYEYLGRHLATWGIVSIMPDTSDEDQIAALANTPAQAFDGPIAAPTLDTSAGVVMVGHSKGGDRIEKAWSQLNNVAGIIYLAQVNSSIVYPKPIVIFGATGDRQSPPNSYATGLYNKWQSPAWKIIIQGGNHSAFTDHKVWLGWMSDDELLIERSRQFVIVQQYSLPLIQRVLGLSQPFAHYLDSPQAEADFTIESK